MIARDAARPCSAAAVRRRMRVGQPDSAHQIGKAGIAAESVEPRIDTQELQLQLARGECLLQTGEGAIAFAKRGIKNRQLAWRDIFVRRLEVAEHRARLLYL